jgi:3-oxoacyl-[acyl-carrier protein] reductase
MKAPLKGRVALVTGGTHGIGRAIALALAQAGADVVATSRHESDIRKIEQIHRRVRTAAVFPSDLALGNLGARGPERLDILVNNIGSALGFKRFDQVTDADWAESFEVNLLSMVRFTRAALPLLRKSKHGRIVNMASLAGKRPGRMNPHYGAMKAAMIHYSKHLSNELAEQGILVNSIAPHTVRAGAWKRDVASKARMDGISVAKAERKLESEVMAKMPLKRLIEPEDVANMVVYLASDAARTVTGQCLVMDGGAVNSIF